MTTKTVHLPGELITEILLRLPVKSVLRCKCACKSWLSLISDPNFASSHFQFAASPTHKLLSINYDDLKKPLSIDFNASPYNDSAFVSLSLDFLGPGYHLEIEIGGSCRGFLFLLGYSDFYIWNPSTGVHKQIPVSNSNNNTFKLLYGFGYDMSSDDYMVVLGSIKYNYRNTSSIDLEIFSLRANKWKQVASDLPYRKTAGYEVGPIVGLFLNGSIHWLVHNYETKLNVIMAIDLNEMTMSEIALPDDFSHRIYDLMVFGGLISVWNVKRSNIKIWVMQEYKVHSSWTKTLELSFSPALNFPPICFTSCGDIVGPDAAVGLAKLNDNGQLLEYHSYGEFYFKRSQMTVYTESLLSIPDGTEQA